MGRLSPRSGRRSWEAPDRASSSSCIGNASRPVGRPPASCPRMSLRLPLTRPGAPAGLPTSCPLEALFQRNKSFQEAWLWWVGGRDPQGRMQWTLGCSRAPGARAAGSPCRQPRLLLFPSPGQPVATETTVLPAKWSFLSLLFLFFVNPGVSCPVPSLTYSSPLHVVGRGSCAGICEDRVLWPWCCLRAVCPALCRLRPSPPAPPLPAPPLRLLLPTPPRSRLGQQGLCEASSARLS